MVTTPRTPTPASSRPSVPLALWLLGTPPPPPAGTAAGVLSPALAERIIAEYTDPGGLVAIPADDANAASTFEAVVRLGRRIRTLNGPSGRVNLAIATPPDTGPDDASTDAASDLFAVALEALAPGGLLATVTQNIPHDGHLRDRPGALTKAAQAAGFTYLQHVIAVLVGIREGQLVPPETPTGTASSADPDSGDLAVVHADVCLYRKPTTTVPTAAPATSEGDRR